MARMVVVGKVGNGTTTTYLQPAGVWTATSQTAIGTATTTVTATATVIVTGHAIAIAEKAETAGS